MSLLLASPAVSGEVLSQISATPVIERLHSDKEDRQYCVEIADIKAGTPFTDRRYPKLAGSYQLQFTAKSTCPDPISLTYCIEKVVFNDRVQHSRFSCGEAQLRSGSPARHEARATEQYSTGRGVVVACSYRSKPCLQTPIHVIVPLRPK